MPQKVRKEMKLAEMLSCYDFESIDPRITEHFEQDVEFPLSVENSVNTVGYTGGRTTGVEALAECEKSRHRPLNLKQVLYHGSDIIQSGGNIIVLGYYFQDPQNRKWYCPYITQAAGRRRLELIPLDSPIPDGSGFLFAYEREGKPFDMVFGGR